VAGELPDSRGRFGPFGGRYAPETLITALERLAEGVQRYLRDPAYQSELAAELKDWVGRPTALSHAPTLSRRWGVEVYFKREDLAHTGAHKINNALGQALLARRLGREARDCRDRRGSAWRGDGRCLRARRAFPASSTWARSMCCARRRMWSAWCSSVPRWCR
jgi:hypothetical protein